jgi:hypothetical protein
MTWRATSARPYLAGTLPPELGQMTGIVTMALAANRLSGSIPQEWCGLVAPANSASVLGKGLHSFTSQLNLSRF